MNEGLYGVPPKGEEILILSDESFGQVGTLGPNVTGLKPGSDVVATVLGEEKSAVKIYCEVG
jgi:hypothetical protein